MFGAPVPGLTRETFLTKLDLVGIGVHPGSGGELEIVLDYSPARDLTDQLLAVHVDAGGNICSVSHES